MSETSDSTSAEPPRLGFLEITVLLLSLYVLAALVIQTAFQLSPEVNVLIDRIDIFVCVVFLAEFAIRFRRAPSKAQFMKWGWIDLVSSVPAFDSLRAGRLVRVFRIIRIIRAFRSVRQLSAFLFRSRAKGLAQSAVLGAVMLVLFSSVSVLIVEDAEHSNIRSPFDAVWWSVSTMTTVGYGDKVPVTPEGKIIAMFLMVTGVGLFGVLTGLFARLVIESNNDNAELARLADELRLLRERIESLDSTRRDVAYDPDAGKSVV